MTTRIVRRFALFFRHSIAVHSLVFLLSVCFPWSRRELKGIGQGQCNEPLAAWLHNPEQESVRTSWISTVNLQIQIEPLPVLSALSISTGAQAGFSSNSSTWLPVWIWDLDIFEIYLNVFWWRVINHALILVRREWDRVLYHHGKQDCTLFDAAHAEVSNMKVQKHSKTSSWKGCI